MPSSFLLLPDNSLGDPSSEVVGQSQWTQLTYTCSSFYGFQVISQVTRLNISASWAYEGELFTCASSKIFFTCLMASVTSWLGGSTRELLAPKEKPPYLKVQIERDTKTWLFTDLQKIPLLIPLHLSPLPAVQPKLVSPLLQEGMTYFPTWLLSHEVFYSLFLGLNTHTTTA